MEHTKLMHKHDLHRILAILLLVFNTNLKAQLSWSCGVQSAAYKPQGQSSVNQPTGCIQFLKDFVPLTSDSVLEVRLKFYIFKPNSGNGTWGHNTNSDAQHLIQRLDSLYSHINTPAQILSPSIAHIPHTRIKFVMVGNINYITNHSIYNHIESAPSSYDDPSAINIYYGAAYFVGFQPNGDTAWADRASASVPGRHILVPQGTAGNPVTKDMDSWEYIHPTAHEIGHALGLDHVTYVPAFVFDGGTFIKPDLGCCDTICANDYVLDSTGTTNNGMMEGGGYFEYLSPQQMAIMHYTLRTALKDVLTTKSYNDATKVSPFAMYNVTSNETWQNGPRHFKGHITVKANKTLTIKCGVSMTKGALIVVEPGALLVVDGGTITNISGRLWDGICLVGNPNQPQKVNNSSNPGSSLYQGTLKIINGGTISHATAGVRNYYSSFSNAGGYIFATDANFIDNYIDVRYIGQQLAGTAQIPNASVFYRCNFKTVGEVGDGLGPLRHISISKTSGIQFYGCVFQYASTVGIPHGDGIYSENGNYSVNKNGNTPTLFQNLEKGIYVNNYNSLKTPNIMNCSFVANMGYAAYFKNADMLSFQSNTVQAYQWGEGVYLNECTKYKIRNNIFTQAGTPSAPGLSIFRSRTGVHEVYRNIFSGLFMGINCMDDNGNPNDDNDGLIMNCNDFHQSSNSYDVVLSHISGLALPRVRKIQGKITSNPLPSELVRNIYGAACNSNQNKWHIYSGSTVTINHGSNTNTLSAVTQPTASGCKSAYLNVVDQNINLDYSLHCSISPPSSGGTSTIQSQRLASMNDYLADLKEDEILNSVSHHSEIQSTVISKLDLYLSDTLLYSPDSVASILEQDQGYMEDADIKTIFAYMNKGDYEGAQDKVDRLDVRRADWADLLTRIIALEQDTMLLISGLSAGDRVFLLDYATTDNKDGQSIAQAYLKAFCDSNYTEPHALPEGEGARTYTSSLTDQSLDVPIIRIYPNPAQTGVSVYYNSSMNATVKIELRDLLGKLIYTNFIYGGISDQYIPLNELSDGMYLITLTRNKEIVYTGKIVKQE